MPSRGTATRRLAVAAALALCALPLAAFDAGGYEEAITALLCDCGCHPQSVKDCACGRAAEMRSEIAALIEAGGPGGAPMTGEQVIDRYVEAQGEQILVAPKARGFNLVAWLGPFVLLLLATGGLFLVVRRWSGRLPEPSTPLPAAAPPGLADAAYRERLRRTLEDMG